MSSVPRGFVFAVAMVVGFAHSLRADVVELKNGQRVDGILKLADQSAVTIEVGGQAVTFKTEQVKAIYFGSVGTPATAAASPINDALGPAKKSLRPTQRRKLAGWVQTPSVSAAGGPVIWRSSVGRRGIAAVGDGPDTAATSDPGNCARAATVRVSAHLGAAPP